MVDLDAPSPRSGQTLTAPSPSLPKDGGALRGIGEKFTNNPVTGTASVGLPIGTASVGLPIATTGGGRGSARRWRCRTTPAAATARWVSAGQLTCPRYDAARTVVYRRTATTRTCSSSRGRRTWFPSPPTTAASSAGATSTPTTPSSGIDRGWIPHTSGSNGGSATMTPTLTGAPTRTTNVVTLYG